MAVQPPGRSAPEARDFPFDVIQVSNGWCVVVYLRNGKPWNLLKPGWDKESNQPYLFESQDKAWQFLKNLFLFSLQCQHNHYAGADKVINCRQCRKIFRAKFYPVCHECLQENEHYLHQLWQGFYYMTGKDDATLQRMSVLLNIPVDKLKMIHHGYANIVSQNIQQQLSLEEEIQTVKNHQPQNLDYRPNGASSRSHKKHSKNNRRYGFKASP
ncbi:MAG: hypothetical protein KTR14_01655 [Vampirovibrio sp.]|nr:hypothetical protein [Vampirovibrio sp.]